MNKSKLFIVIFIGSIILVSPFIINKIINKNENNEGIKNIEEIAQKENEIDNNKKEDANKNNNIVNNSENIIKNTMVSKDYFNDALFIGDSRTVGIMEYGNLSNATFFANTGMSVYNVFDKKISVPKVGKLNLEELLSSKKFGKIYVMLGINELGYNFNNTVNKYKKLVEYLQKKEPNAIIYIQANLHVARKQSETNDIFNNHNINKFNNAISKIADNKKIFYIDINEKFDDESGSLSSDYTKDNVHIYGKYYTEWSDWLRNNTIKEEN